MANSGFLASAKLNPSMSDQPRSRAFLWVILGGGAFFLFLVAIFALVYFSVRSQQKDGFSGFGDKIGVVDLEGVIINPKDVVEQLRKFADDSSIKAIVLHVDSPGGGAAASEEIYREVLRIRDKKKKMIVASIGTVGASGAYYVSSAANKIFADDASIVGSIGVIAEWYNYEELLKWAKLQAITLKAGEFKDTGSPTRPMTPEERAYLQGLIDNMHTQFIHSVAVGRKMQDAQVRALANGKVWTGQEAVPLKLVDQIGDFRTAIEDTAKSVGIKGEPTLVHPEKERKSLLDLMFGDVSDYLPDAAKLMQTNVGFYYLWK
jgi:protease-4